jgi:pyridoxal phosphate enzyme (YggS family)
MSDRAELNASGLPELASIRRRIAAACARSSRSPDEVVLLGASKRQPVELLKRAFDAGLRTFGENRVQEAEQKKSELPPEIDWHLIGPLQSNKARRAVQVFSTVHSIDRAKIARVLDREAEAAGRTVEVFLQFNLGAEPSKSGFEAHQLGDCCELFALRSLRIRGLMTIPPPTADAESARPWFVQLRSMRDELKERLGSHAPAFPGDLSMGMSSDFEVAIEEGATHVRVGTALFGTRAS